MSISSRLQKLAIDSGFTQFEVIEDLQKQTRFDPGMWVYTLWGILDGVEYAFRDVGYEQIAEQVKGLLKRLDENVPAGTAPTFVDQLHEIPFELEVVPTLVKIVGRERQVSSFGETTTFTCSITIERRVNGEVRNAFTFQPTVGIPFPPEIDQRELDEVVMHGLLGIAKGVCAGIAREDGEAAKRAHRAAKRQRDAERSAAGERSL